MKNENEFIAKIEAGEYIESYDEGCLILSVGDNNISVQVPVCADSQILINGEESFDYDKFDDAVEVARQKGLEKSTEFWFKKEHDISELFEFYFEPLNCNFYLMINDDDISDLAIDSCYTDNENETMLREVTEDDFWGIEDDFLSRFDVEEFGKKEWLESKE